MIHPRPGLREYNRQRRLRLVAPLPAPVEPTPIRPALPPVAPPLRSFCAHCVERRPVATRRDRGRDLHLCVWCVRAFDEGGLAFVPDPLWIAARNRSIA